MARVYVYERPVDSVLTDVSFYEKLHPVTGVVLVKQEPLDTDGNSQDSSVPLADSSVNTTTPAETTVQGTQQLEDVSNKENELVSSKNHANKDKSGTDVVNTKKRKRLTYENLKKPDAVPAPVSQQPKRACRSSLERRSPEPPSEVQLVECGVCFLKFRTEKSLKIHRDYYHEITDRICDKCQMSFRSIGALDTHKSRDKCNELPIAKWKGERYFCCFCNRRFSNKPNLQSHVFHIHNELLPNAACGRGGLSGLYENYDFKNINETDTIQQSEKLNNPDEISEPPLTQSTNGHKGSPSIPQKEISPSGSPTPKKLRQTTITEFLSGFTKKEQASPKKVDLMRESPKKLRAKQNGRMTEKFNVPEETPKRVVPKQNGIITEKFELYGETPGKIRKNGAVAKFASTPGKTSTTGESSRSSSKACKEKRPFVEIYMDSNEMVALLDKKVKIEVEDEYSDSTPQNGSYNLRRVTRNSLDCPSSDINLPPVTKAQKTRKSRGQSTGTPKRKSKNLSKEQRQRAKFNCKECKVNLVRCDMVVKTEIVDYVPPTPVSVDEDIEEVWRKKVKLKKIHVPLVRLNDVTKVEVNDTFHNPEKSTARQANSKTKLRTIFRCKVCKKFFSSKKNLYNHLEGAHVFYISSVCSAWYKSRARLLRHYLHQHCVMKRMECCVCFEKFTSPVFLKRHMSLHCIKVFQSKRDKLFNKEAAKCNMHSRTNSCEACGKHFWLGACLSEHQQVCHKMRAQLKKSRQAQCAVKTSPTNKTPEPPLAVASVTVMEQHPEELSTVKDNSPRTESPSGAQPKRLLRGVAFAKGYNIDDSSTDKEKFSCTTCGAHFQSFQNLCLHERTYSQPATHVCESCNTGFTTQKLLQNHVTATHMLDTLQRYKYFCTFCTQGFLKKVNLQIHTGHFHGGQTPIIPKPWLDTTSAWEVNTVCNVCNLIFESSERFIEHNMYYYKGQVFTCTFCNQIFQGMYMLNHHNKFVHYTEEMTKLYTYMCNICNEGFTQESQHHAHKLHVHSAMAETNAQLLQDHTYAITTGNGGSPTGPTMRYNCEVCYMNFMVEEDLRQHKMEYSNDGEYLCSYCARKCPTDAILNKHESLSHTCCNFTDCYKCRYCEEVLSTCTALKCHEIHFHQKISDSPVKSNIQSTVNQTSNPPGKDGNVGTVGNVGPEKVLACTICGMKFAALEKLNHHILEYSNVGLYNCHICNRRFPELYRLEVHKLKHTNLNFILSKHHCPICREGFANPVNVRTHVKHFHKDASIDQWVVTDGQISQAVCHTIEEPKGTPSSLSKQSTMCLECSVSYDSESALRRHQARFANEGQHACEHCGRRFQQVKLLRDHLKRHAAGIQRLKYACPECDDRFGNPLARYQHIVHLHGKSKWKGDVPINIMARNDAEISDERLEDDESDVSSHRTDTPTDQLIRTVAATNTVSELSNDQGRSPTTIDEKDDIDVVEVQEETHLDSSKKATMFYSCPLCEFKINMLEAFVLHLKLEHGKMIEGTVADTPQTSAERVISCLTCGVTFTTENELKIHLKNAHVRICPTNREDATESAETDADVVQIVWEKKLDAATQFGDQGDSEVHVLCWSYCAPIINYDKTVAKPELDDLSAGQPSLRIKEFPKLA